IQPLVKSIISYHQFAGVKGRQSHEANFIANEVLDSRKRSGKPGLILKLDIEKAFDSVNWNCLFNIVRSMGFNQKFHKWIKGIVSQSKLSVLVNGEATGFFSMERGLEQGLLSGFYFDEDRRRGEVSHILYADDAVIFCDATEHEVTNLLAVLLCFQSVTGLKVNLEKSKLFPVGEVPHLDRLADLLCCDWDFLPTIYLGLPLGASPTSGTIWNPLISRVQSRLQGWKGRFLSIGGRLVLIKSVLASQPTYLCSLYRAPTHVVQTIEKLQCSFLWSGSQEQNKFHLVSWDRCKQPKKWGGLGIPDFKRHNTALLSKWWWKFACGDSWWKDLMRIKYPNEDSQWMPGKPLSPVFTVHSLYQELTQEEGRTRTTGVQGGDFPYKSVWLSHVPSKICLFVWLTYHRKILTQDALKQRGWIMPNRCPLCCAHEEDPSHFFITCSFTMIVWRSLVALYTSMVLLPVGRLKTSSRAGQL
ncbi:unnamed protein product, partial [Linum tenue]